MTTNRIVQFLDIFQGWTVKRKELTGRLLLLRAENKQECSDGDYYEIEGTSFIFNAGHVKQVIITKDFIEIII